MRCGSRRGLATLLLGTLLGVPATARAADPVPITPGPDSEVCERAGRDAERAAGIPDGLLLAIGQVESGRRDPLTRRVVAWPWTLNIAGQGQLFATREAALAALRGNLALGLRSIDVGCFQVNLLHHPAAFRGAEDALDPVANASYAARFLALLRAESGSWDSAVGRYHSGLAERGEPYRADVLARWTGLPAPAAPPAGARAATAPDRYVVRVVAAPRLPQVWMPSAASGTAPMAAIRYGLPRVITPSRLHTANQHNRT